jgi:hypothetical protein
MEMQKIVFSEMISFFIQEWPILLGYEWKICDCIVTPGFSQFGQWWKLRDGNNFSIGTACQVDSNNTSFWSAWLLANESGCNGVGGALQRDHPD